MLSDCEELVGVFDLISTCDMCYSKHSAEFQIKKINLGPTADVGTLQRLPHLISQGIVRELAYTGRKFSGEEACKSGLVNRCYEDQKNHDELKAALKLC